ncbi:hypothetical protein FQA39_LY02269 [Lamprigera yunnana]|nr:hypothetical protein FQA39_LY02269 [Lamprigera yunnana]
MIMVWKHLWNYLLLLLFIVMKINGDELNNAGVDVYPTMYLTMLQMLQKSLLQMYKDASSPSNQMQQHAHIDLTKYNDVLKSDANMISSVLDNNMLKSLNSALTSPPQQIYHLPSSSTSHLIPTDYSNGSIKMRPLFDTLPQPQLISSSHLTVPNIQNYNTRYSSYPSFQDLDSQGYGGGFPNGLNTHHYGGRQNLFEPNSYKTFQNGFGSSGYEPFENGFGGFQHNIEIPSKFMPSYLKPPMEYSRYGMPRFRTVRGVPNRYKSSKNNNKPLTSPKTFRKPIVQKVPHRMKITINS